VTKIKSRLFIGLSLILAILLCGMVAAEVTVSATTSTLKLDYADLGEDDKRLDFDSEAITVTNTGDASESVTLTLSDPQDSFRNLVASPSSFTLAPNATQTVTLSGKAPDDLDYNYNEVFTTLTIAASNTLTVDFKAEVAPMIEINSVYVYVDGDEEDNYNDEGSVEEIHPGDEIELRFILKNRYDDDYEDGDISGTIEVELDDFDLDNEEVDFDLTAGDDFGKSDAPKINFTIPLNTDDGEEYEIYFTFSDLKSDSGAEFELEDWTLTFTVEKDRDALSISKLKITPEEVECSREIEISGELENIGSDDQPDASVNFYSQYLGINKMLELPTVRDGESKTFTQTFEIGSEVKMGNYPIDIYAYIDGDDEMDNQHINLMVKDCATSQPVVEEEQEENESVTPVAEDGETTATPVSSSNIVKTVEKSYTKDDYLAGIMLVGLVLAVILIVVFAILLLK